MARTVSAQVKPVTQYLNCVTMNYINYSKSQLNVYWNLTLILRWHHKIAWQGGNINQGHHIDCKNKIMLSSLNTQVLAYQCGKITDNWWTGKMKIGPDVIPTWTSIPCDITICCMNTINQVYIWRTMWVLSSTYCTCNYCTCLEREIQQCGTGQLTVYCTFFLAPWQFPTACVTHLEGIVNEMTK